MRQLNVFLSFALALAVVLPSAVTAQAPPKADPGVKAGAPKAEVPKAEVPKAEVPKAEVPKAEVPKAEVPKAETPPMAKPSGMGMGMMRTGAPFSLAVTVEQVDPKWEAKPKAGLMVKLDVLASQTVVKSITEKSGADGIAAFSNVPSVPGAQYMVTVNHEGTVYRSTDRIVPSGAAKAHVLIYPSTGDPSGLTVKKLLMSVDLGEQYLFMQQTWTIVNSSPTIFDYSRSIDPLHKEGLALVLPEGADGLHAKVMFSGGAMEDAETFQNKVLIKAPIMPSKDGSGHVSVQVSYSMKLRSSEFHYAQKMNLPVESVELIVPQTTGYKRFPTLDLALTAPGFSQVGNNRTVPGYRQDMNFLLAKGARVPVGASLVFSVVGYPVGDDSMRWYALGAALLAIFGGGLLYAGERRKLAAGGPGTKVKALRAERERLYEVLVDLEDAYEAGQLSDRNFEVQAAEQRERLALVLRLLDEIATAKASHKGSVPVADA